MSPSPLFERSARRRALLAGSWRPITSLALAVIALAAPGGRLSAADGSSAARRPNIVMILADDKYHRVRLEPNFPRETACPFH